jgi:hypothetical protein
VSEALARLNWIFACEGDDFDVSLTALTTAIDTDLEWVKEHTRLLTRAIEWEAKGHDRSLILRGNNLKEAEEWLGKSGQKEPRPTSQQTGYIIACQRGDQEAAGPARFGNLRSCRFACPQLPGVDRQNKLTGIF